MSRPSATRITRDIDPHAVVCKSPPQCRPHAGPLQRDDAVPSRVTPTAGNLRVAALDPLELRGSASITACERMLRASQSRVSKGCSNSNSFVSTFAPVRHQALPSQVQRISSPRCGGRSARYRVLPIGTPLFARRSPRRPPCPSRRRRASPATIGASAQRSRKRSRRRSGIARHPDPGRDEQPILMRPMSAVPPP